ncbi:MAG: FkbM family methyltransferase [Pedobacter sp.]|uniref:FkbM family methyltransferase n=1 Tax=Pedobacter sp. TaxID=1411316 RepID=UPI0028091345|nr:FkbM family methyltransferase [Pedobacter sp.]MDQ8004875.1 FkbM family methyltransferase [Pedobacter sp.]
MIQIIKKIIKRTFFKWYWNLKGTFPYYKHQVYFPKNSVIFLRAIEEGIYEMDNVKILNNLVRDNTYTFDIGANIGLMAIPILSRNSNNHVISIEPSPSSFPFLSKTHKSSNFNKQWHLINKAVSNKSGTIDFQIATTENAAYESVMNTSRTNFINSIQVDCTTIDEIWNSFNNPEISFIKIDIEGADLLALHGGKECIKKCRPSILMEWNKINIIPFNLSNLDLLKFTTDIDYTIYALPYFSKCTTIKDLELLSKMDENFLLIPN